MATGIELIAAERERQIRKRGFDSSHDDYHTKGELALAAVCYASPVPVLVSEYRWRGHCFVDPWPWTDDGSDKRLWDECGPKSEEWYGRDERIRQLVKAGALIAAEIDRLQRAQKGR